MSSILDALKKLEEEKARENDPTDLPLDEVIAAQEILGKRHKGGRGFDGWGSRLVVPISLGTSFLLVCLSLVVVYVSVKNHSQASPFPVENVQANVKQAPVEQNTGQSVPEKTSTVLVAQTPVEPQRPIQNSPPPATASKVEVPTPDPVAPPNTSPSSEPPQQTTDAVVYVRSEPVQVPKVPPTRREPPPVSKEPPRETSVVEEASVVTDPTLLPILTPSDQERLGLPRLKVNFVSQASSQRPQPYALINYKKVYAGETIPSTNARLIAVSVQGVGIEIGGQKFFVPAR